jgi:hypothetical protein
MGQSAATARAPPTSASAARADGGADRVERTCARIGRVCHQTWQRCAVCAPPATAFASVGAVLDDPAARERFRAYLRAEFCEENMLFLDKCDALIAAHARADRRAAVGLAAAIVADCFTEGGTFEVCTCVRHAEYRAAAKRSRAVAVMHVFRCRWRCPFGSGRRWSTPSRLCGVPKLRRPWR